MADGSRVTMIGVVGETAVCRRFTTMLRTRYGIPTLAVAETAYAFAAEEARPDPPRQIPAPTGHHAPEKRLVQHGPEYFVRQVVAWLEKSAGDWPVICLPEPMTPSMIQTLRAQFGAYLIVVAVAGDGETAVSAPSLPAGSLADRADVHISLRDEKDDVVQAQIEKRLIPRLPTLPSKEVSNP